MALYALGDQHLSLNSNKSMEIFGDGWQDRSPHSTVTSSGLRAEKASFSRST